MQQQEKQFQIRRTQVVKASPTLTPLLQQDQRKQGLRPLQIFQQDQQQKGEKEYVPKLKLYSQYITKQLYPKFDNIKGDVQQLSQIQNQDSIFDMKNKDLYHKLQLSNQILLQLNKRLEDKSQKLIQVIDDLEQVARDLKIESQESSTKIHELQQKYSKQKLKKKFLKEKVHSLQQEIISLEEKASNSCFIPPLILKEQGENQFHEDEQDIDENNSDESQGQMVLTHDQLLQMIDYLQSRAQQSEWLEDNLQNYQQQDIDTDNMTYEQLLALEEEIGNVSRGLKQSQIKMIPKSEVKIIEEMPDKCSVCQNEFQLQEKYRELGCKHRYHSKCIKIWLKNEKQCPMCKCEVKIQLEDKSEEEQKDFEDEQQ